MAFNDKIEAVKKVTDALSDKAVDAQHELQRAAPNAEHFQTLLDSSKVQAQPNFQKVEAQQNIPDANPAVNSVIAQEDVKVQGNGTATDQERKRRQLDSSDEVVVDKVSTKPGSLMDEVRNLNSKVTNMSKMSTEDIKGQSKQLIAQIEDVKTQLSQSPGDIKSSYQTLLRNRLTHIDANLKIALSKAGVEYTPPADTTIAAKSPIEKFIGYLTNSQHQLENLNKTIDALNLDNANLTPANMLALQIKVGYVQQQIELFTSLLNKALESTKTIMNVQV
jgi:hypothetical protein